MAAGQGGGIPKGSFLEALSPNKQLGASSVSLTWSTMQFHLQNWVSGSLLFCVGRGLVGIALTVAKVLGVCGTFLSSERGSPVVSVVSPIPPVVCWDPGGDG